MKKVTLNKKHYAFSSKTLSLLTYQNSGDYISPVQQSICVVTSPHETRCGHVSLLFVPVANLEECDKHFIY